MKDQSSIFPAQGLIFEKTFPMELIIEIYSEIIGEVIENMVEIIKSLAK